MGERAAYSRVYWEIVDDSKFVTVYDSDAHLAAWLRLLLIADQSHPASAHLPTNVRRQSVNVLADVGLIDILPGHRYRIHGLDAERQRRRDNATSRPPSGPGRPPDGIHADTARHRSGPESRGLRRDETRQAEDETDARDGERWDAPETEALQWLAKHGCDIRPGNGYHRHLIGLVEVHGVNAVVGMFDRLAEAGMKQGDTQGFVFGAKDALNARSRPDLHALEQDDAREERAENRSKRIQEQMRARRLEWFTNTGKWDEAWGPAPLPMKEEVT